MLLSLPFDITFVCPSWQRAVQMSSSLSIATVPAAASLYSWYVSKRLDIWVYSLLSDIPFPLMLLFERGFFFHCVTLFRGRWMDDLNLRQWDSSAIGDRFNQEDWQLTQFCYAFILWMFQQQQEAIADFLCLSSLFFIICVLQAYSFIMNEDILFLSIFARILVTRACASYSATFLSPRTCTCTCPA